MADHEHGDHHHPTAMAEQERHAPPQFDPDEIAEFDRDDVSAGRNIARMLAIFFVYTVVVMSLAAWWTYMAIKE